MKQYGLLTFTGNDLSGYETLISASPAEAIAYADGMLTERTKQDLGFLTENRVNYVVEEGCRDLFNIHDGAGETLATWSFSDRGDAGSLTRGQLVGPVGPREPRKPEPLPGNLA